MSGGPDSTPRHADGNRPHSTASRWIGGGTAGCGWTKDRPPPIVCSRSDRSKEDDMTRRANRVFAFLLTLAGAAASAGNAFATPPSGFTGTTLALGRLGEFHAFNHAVPEGSPRRLWLSLQRTKGASDLYVQSNVWQPGGTTGWHTHPGHSLIIVTAGTVTAYDGDDPSCTPHVYTTGMAFVDEGGDHVHVLRNEDAAVEAKTIAVQLIAAGATRRIDAPASPDCPF
jgi:quercetin dioxygenase-like cupin family protein